MKSTNYLLLALLLGCVLFGGCSSDSNSSNDAESSPEIILGKVTLENGWARPGSQGDKSAAYLTITNGTASTDTLIDFSSPAAQSVELHKSIQNEDGTIEMRPADRQPLASGEKLTLHPGGLHLMFNDLERDLSVGDSLSVSVEFSRAGTYSTTIPVQLQN